MRRWFVASLAASVAALVVVGCSAAPSDSDTSESELRTLTSGEIVGTLHYGETSAPVAYTENPLYRAFRFDAAPGDKVDVWVRSSSGDARAWLLSSSFGTLASNDNADSTTHDSHIAESVKTGGTYYIAFRDANREDNPFTVSLAGGGTTDAGASDGGVADSGTSGTDGGAGGVDPFDDALGKRAPITSTEARTLFAPGATTAGLGNFAMAERVRTCNETTGCTDWVRPAGVTFAYSTYELWNPGPGWSNQKSCFQFKSNTYTSVTGGMSLTVNGSGQFGLGLSSNPTGAATCANVTAGQASCGTFDGTSIPTPTGGSSCNLPNPAGAGVTSTAYPASVTLYDTTKTTGSPLSMSVLVTSSYVYGRFSAKGETDTTGSHKEVEYALYGLMQQGATPTFGGGSACKPTTCASQGKTCGTTSDGCGGTLSCGSCSYPYTCGTSNTCEVPAGCNLQPCYAGASVSYTCCSSGQVTCSNGQGCTCYDACF